MKRARNLQYLQACLLLPLSDSEMGLLRTIAHQYAMNTHAEWGLANAHMAPAVQGLFLRLQGMMDVQAA
jgi:hypothetical protein